MIRLAFALLALLVAFPLSAQQVPAAGAPLPSSRLSSAFRQVFSSMPAAAGLATPGLAYAEAWCQWPTGTASHTYCGIDLEHIVANYSIFHDIMGLASVAPGDTTAVIAVQVGDPFSSTPDPSQAQTFVTTTTIAADTWYKLRVNVDFRTRTWVSVVFNGETFLPTTSGGKLQFPERSYFGLPFFGLYPHAVANSADRTEPGEEVVLIDDVCWGFVGVEDECEDFESDVVQSFNDVFQAENFVPSPLTEGLWYEESDLALVSVVASPNARSGSNVLRAEASTQTADVNPPVILIPAKVKTKRKWVTLTGAALDDMDVSRVEVRVLPPKKKKKKKKKRKRKRIWGPWQVLPHTSTFDFSLAVKKRSKYWVEVRAFDASGNVSSVFVRVVRK